jgi:hypothetical protein
LDTAHGRVQRSGEDFRGTEQRVSCPRRGRRWPGFGLARLLPGAVRRC